VLLPPCAIAENSGEGRRKPGRDPGHTYSLDLGIDNLLLCRAIGFSNYTRGDCMSTRIEDLMIELSKDPYRAMQFTEKIGDRQELDRTLHMAKSKNEGKKTKKPKGKKK